MCPTVAPMSERSIYLRDQAAKCRWHADQMTDAETQEQLRKLAAEYIERAAEIESKEAPRLAGSLITRRHSGYFSDRFGKVGSLT